MSALDLDAVDELCRLALVAGRLGCRIRLEGATDELRDLLRLAGVDAVLVPEHPNFNPTGADLA